MANNGGGTPPAPMLLLALPNPHALLDNPLARAAASRIEELQGRIKEAFSQALASLPPQLRNLFPDRLTASQISRRAILSNRSSPLRCQNFAAIIPGDSLAELVVTRGITNFFSLYNTLLIVRIICTWFPDAPRAIVNPISTVTDPYLNLFRGLIPPLGGTLDFSPILAFLLLDAFGNAATALPAELPKPEAGISAAASSRRNWRQRKFLPRNSSP
ncbi:ylmG homolog protein 2, chloroplastic [Selaginella moellendorffii]|nr:ylmG homolog protein 2, chloroplastic [Selaginella moellendorffii]|eukprot:XP_002976887.2 ylmG homolog protein 2, chloroplastic [Selaginella moellendorffii]